MVRHPGIFQEKHPALKGIALGRSSTISSIIQRKQKIPAYAGMTTIHILQKTLKNGNLFILYRSQNHYTTFVLKKAQIMKPIQKPISHAAFMALLYGISLKVWFLLSLPKILFGTMSAPEAFFTLVGLLGTVTAPSIIVLRTGRQHPPITAPS